MKLGIIMDPIQGIKIKKDSSFAMLLAAQALGWKIYYMEISDLFLANTESVARMRHLTVKDDAAQWYQFGAEMICELATLAKA